MRLTVQDLGRSFGRKTAEEGRRLAADGGVDVLRLAGEEGLVFGRAAGHPVAGRLELDESGALRLSGVCGCPRGGGCEHVAAVFWAARRELKDAKPHPFEKPSPPPKLEPVRPVPQLRLFGRRMLSDHPWRRDHPTEIMAMAHPSFLYGSRAVAALDPDESIPRDAAFEASCLSRLAALGLVPERAVAEPGSPAASSLDLHVGTPGRHDERELLDLSLDGFPRLQAEGWTVVEEDSYPFRVVAADARWYAEVSEGKVADWFDLEVGIEIDGKRISLLPILLSVLSDPRWKLTPEQIASLPDDGRLPARLKDGRILPLPSGRVRAILWTLAELYGTARLGRGGTLHLSRLNAPRLAELDARLEGDLEWSGGEGIRQLGRRLRDFRGITQAPVPKTFDGTLRPYQLEGLSWLQFLRENGLSGVLADDMGLGKTVMVLAHLLAEKEAGRLDRPCLVVAPTSLMPNWRRESERFAPALSVLTLQGPARRGRFDEAAGHDIVLTTYPLLPRDEAFLTSQNWHALVLDEAQFIKNPNTKAARVARKLEARHRLCLTGTPMENHLGELWSLFHVLMPGLLGDEPTFRRVFRAPIERDGSVVRREQLSARVRPFMLRRTKEEVARELPPKTEITQLVELEGAQRDVYESIRLSMHEWVRTEIARKGIGRSTIALLEALLRLRQVCCDPRLLKLKGPSSTAGSAKLSTLIQMLEEMIDEGRKVLVFSQFTSMLALIEPELKERGIEYVKLTGSTVDRESPVRRFQGGEVSLFLVSLKAGGTGLNLTAADTVIHYDPWWNPAVEAQASDRAHRIGQDKPVFVYKLIVAGSVEEKIVALQARKKELADAIYGEGADLSRLIGAEEIEELFKPIE